MRIGITGDTHSNTRSLRKIVQQAPPVDLWLHTGDHDYDANLLQALSGLKVVRVLGNCDALGSQEAKPDEFLELEGFKLWLTHGHKYIERNERQDMGYWAGVFGADIAIYGHTHVPVQYHYGDILLLNPGSPARPRSSQGPTFAVLELKAGEEPVVEMVKI